MDVLNQILDVIREGFYEVNAVQGLIIALVAVVMIPGWNRLFYFAIGATLVHILVDILLPVVASGAAFRLPPFVEVSFWRDVGVLFIGYLVVIAILLLIKNILFRRR